MSAESELQRESGRTSGLLFLGQGRTRAEAQRYQATNPLSVLTLFLFGQCDGYLFQVLFPTQQQCLVPLIPFTHQLPLYMSVLPRSPGYLTSFPLAFLKILVFPFLNN